MKKFILLTLLVTSAILSQAGPTDPPGSLHKLAPMQIRQTAARPDVPGALLLELGWNGLQNNPEQMNIKSFGSRTMNVYYFYPVAMPLEGLYLMPGLGLGMDRYKFDGDYTLLQNTEGDVSFSDISGISPKKSMLVVNYIDLPVEFRYYLNDSDRKRSFNIGFGAKIGMRLNSKTKIKYEEAGDNITTKIKRPYNLKNYRYGLTGRLGIGGFNVFGYYSLSELFDDGPANTADTNNFTIGLSFEGF